MNKLLIHSRVKKNKVAGFLIPLLMIIFLFWSFSLLSASDYKSFQVVYGHKYIGLKGFRDLGNPHRLTPDSNGEIGISYLAHRDDNANTIYNFPIKIAMYIPPFLTEVTGGQIFFNYTIPIGFCIKYKNFPLCSNVPNINDSEGWDNFYTTVFPDDYYNEVHFKNLSGNIALLYITKPINDELSSGWLFFNEINPQEGGVGIRSFSLSFNVNYNDYVKWYDSIKEPLNPNDSSFYYSNCVDSNHPQNYTRHNCIVDGDNICENVPGFKNSEYTPYYYYTKNGDSSGKKYFYCWVPGGNYSNGEIIWDIWSDDIYFPVNSTKYQCSPSNLQYCNNQSDCENIGHGYWYDNKCNSISKEEKCLQDIQYCDNETLCSYYKDNKPDNSTYWDNSTNKCTFSCSEQHLDFCDNQTACDEVFGEQGHWYNNECNLLTKEEKCLQDIQFCDNETLCTLYHDNKDNASYWNGESCTFHCSLNHLGYCDNQTACNEVFNDGKEHWYDNKCNFQDKEFACLNQDIKYCDNETLCDLYHDNKDNESYWNGETCTFHCSQKHLDYCDNQAACENAGGYWINNRCSSINIECLNNPDKCTTQELCEEAHYQWYNGKCEYNCSYYTLDSCHDKNSCENAGGVWNGSSCNSKPKSCSLSIIFAANFQHNKSLCIEYNCKWENNQCVDPSSSGTPGGNEGGNGSEGENNQNNDNITGLNNWEIDDNFMVLNTDSCNGDTLTQNDKLTFIIRHKGIYNKYVFPIFGIIYSDGSQVYYEIKKTGDFYRLTYWNTSELSPDNTFEFGNKLFGKDETNYATINVFQNIFQNGEIDVCSNQVQFENILESKTGIPTELDNISQILLGTIVMDKLFTLKDFLYNEKSVTEDNVKKLPIKGNGIFGWKYKLLNIDCSQSHCTSSNEEDNNSISQGGNETASVYEPKFVNYIIDNNTLTFDESDVINDYNVLLLGYLENKGEGEKVYFDICRDGSVGLVGGDSEYQNYLNGNIYNNNCINYTENQISLSQSGILDALKELCNSYNIKMLEFYINKKLFNIVNLLHLDVNSNKYYFYYREKDFCSWVQFLQ